MQLCGTFVTARHHQFTTVFDFRHLQRLGAAGAARRRERRRHDVEPRGAWLRRGRRPRGGLPEAAAPKTQVLKVLVLGDPATGKTSIIKRYVHNFFSNHHRTTVGVDFALKQLTVGRRAGAARVGSARCDGATPQGHDGAAAALGHRGPGPLRRHRARAAPRRRARSRRSRNTEVAGLLQGRVRRVPRLRHQPTGDVQDHRRARRDSRRARATAFLRLERTSRLETSRDDLDSQVKWKDEIDSKVHLPNGMALPVVLLANKCDLEDVAIDRQELDDFCRSHGFIGWFETSAKADVNIDTAARRPRPAGPSPGKRDASRRRGASWATSSATTTSFRRNARSGRSSARRRSWASRGPRTPTRAAARRASVGAATHGAARAAAPGRPPASYLVTPRSPCARRAPRLLSRTRPTRPPPPTRRSGGAAAAPSRRRRGASRR